MSDVIDISPDGLNPSQFEKSRKRPASDRAKGLLMPIQGFGGGSFTLYAPSPKSEVGIVWENGKPVHRQTEGCMSDPRIASLRDKVILSMRSFGPGRIQIDFAFLEYAAAVLGLVYNLSDSDLQFLLQGNGWHKAMIAHLLGGSDVVSTLAAIEAPKPIVAPAPRDETGQAYIPLISTLESTTAPLEFAGEQIVPSLWNRIRRRVRRIAAGRQKN